MNTWLAPEVATYLQRARHELDASAAAKDPIEKYRHAHTSALRTAGGLLALHPPKKRVRSFNAWERISAIDEKWIPWARYFAGGAKLRQGIEAGWVTSDEVKRYLDIVEYAHNFLDEVQREAEQQFTPISTAS